MSVVEFISELQSRGIRLYLHEGRLRCSAPTGTLTDELRKQLADHRDEIVEFLSRANRTAAAKSSVLPAAPAREFHPLSYQQRRLWFLSRLEGDNSPTYNIPVAIRLRGRLDRAALDAGLRTVIERHGALRTTFGQVEGEPVQRIRPTVALELDVIDADPAEAPELARAFVHRPFKLDEDTLIRGCLYRLSPEDHLLVLALHHIICDGWSMSIIARELAATYAAAVRSQPSPLEQPPAQYIDFVHWQRTEEEQQRLERELAYWKQQLRDVPRLTELPTDRPRPPVQTHRGAQVNFELDADLVAALEQLGRKHDCTPFMTALAAYYVLLARYTGQHDLAVGSPIANRNNEAIEGVVGFFANTVVLRTQVDPSRPFIDLLRQVREVTLDAYAHQSAPFERVVEAVAGDRSLSHMPLYQVEFVFQNTPAKAVTVPDLTIEFAEPESAVSKFDLGLGMVERDGVLLARFEYDTDLFDRSTIERLVAHYCTLLRSVTATPDAPIARLEMLPLAERQQLLEVWNRPEVATTDDTCVHDLFEQQARRSPHSVALVFRNQHITYAALDRLAERLAVRLRAEGIGPDVLVGLCLHRSPSLFIGMLGILKAGGAYVPLDPTYPSERLRYMITESKAPVVVTEEALRPLFDGLDAKLVLLDSRGTCAPAATAALSEQNLRSSPDSLAYVIFTSGSTGTPKGVALDHRPLVNMVRWYVGSFPLDHGHRTLQFASISFDVSFEEAFTTWNTGGTLMVLDEEQRISPRTILGLLATWGVDRMLAPVVLLQAIAREHCADPSAPIPHLLQIITSGSQLQISQEIRQFAQAMPGCVLHNFYGPAETHGVTREPMGANPDQWPALPSIGRPIANTRCYSIGSHGELLPIGVKGELMIGGVAVGRGYWNRPSLTAERFVPDPYDPHGGGRLYRSGDLVRFAADGRLHWLGRLDDMVKVRGVRIELGEIEAALRLHPGVREVAARVWRTSAEEEQLIAYVQVEPDAAIPSDAEMRAFLLSRLPSFMVPGRFLRVDTMPIGPNGKIDRRALPEPELSSLPEDQYVGPRNDTERLVADVWAEILGMERVGIQDNFFAIGGHSLMASRIVARLNTLTGLALPLRVIFEKPTVAEVAEQLDERRLAQRVQDLRIDDEDAPLDADEDEMLI